MRAVLFMFLLLALGLAPALAQSQTALPLVTHKPSAATTGTAAPAAPAIIPGSPLAAIAGATAPHAAENGEAEPFGSDQLGFVISGAVGEGAVHAFHSFLDAVHASTRLTPVTQWLVSFPADHARQADANGILLALLMAMLPAVLIDNAIKLSLRHPAQLCAQWARPRGGEFLPTAETPETAEAPEDNPEPGPEPGPAPAPELLADEEELVEIAPVRRRRFVSLRAWARRLGFATLKLLLMLLPLAGFIITVQIGLSAGFVARHASILAVTSTANAYLCCRLAQEVGRFIFNPAAPSLRLINLSTERAVAFMRWLLVVVVTVFCSWILISWAAILDLSHDGVAVLLRIAVLIVHLEVAFGIWQCRHLVGAWIIGKRKRGGAVAWLRQHFGHWWHYFALFYVLALWVAWAGGVENAFFVLLRAIVVVILTIILGRFAWGGSYNLLERVFADPASSRFPSLVTRARAYSPLIGFLLRAVIVITALVFILQGWGVDAMFWLHHNPVSQALITAFSSVLVTAGIAVSLWEICNYALHARVEKLGATGRRRQATRLRTLAPILRAAAGTFIFAIAFVVCLSDIGVNTTGLLAVSSIAGIAVGFGSQRLVQDVITGLFLLLEDAVQVGDAVTLGGISGTVERLSIRTIRLRGSDGSINIIPFSSVTIVTNATRDFNYAEISVTIGYHEDIDHACAVLADIGRNMRAEPVWGAMMRDDLQIFGLDKFGERGMVVTGQIRTGPGQNAAVRREFYRRVQLRFAQEGIIIPLGQQQVFRLEMAQLPPPETKES
jgi:moderate conductance mechanosensitive channel